MGPRWEPSRTYRQHCIAQIITYVYIYIPILPDDVLSEGCIYYVGYPSYGWLLGGPLGVVVALLSAPLFIRGFGRSPSLAAGINGWRFGPFTSKGSSNCYCVRNCTASAESCRSHRNMITAVKLHYNSHNKKHDKCSHRQAHRAQRSHRRQGMLITLRNDDASYC